MAYLQDLDNTKPKDFFAYTVPNTKPKRTEYILKTDIIRLKNGDIPKKFDFETGNGALYYRDNKGKFGGSGCAAYFLNAEEIVEHLMQDHEFIRKCIDADRTWFLPEEITEMFVF